MAIGIIANLGSGGDSAKAKTYIIKDGVLQDGTTFVSTVNNFGGSTVNGYYRVARTAGSGTATALGRSSTAFDFNGKRLYAEGYASATEIGRIGTNSANNITSDGSIGQVKFTVTSGIEKISTNAVSGTQYVYLGVNSAANSQYCYIKNLWIQ